MKYSACGQTFYSTKQEKCHGIFVCLSCIWQHLSLTDILNLIQKMLCHKPLNVQCFWLILYRLFCAFYSTLLIKTVLILKCFTSIISCCLNLKYVKFITCLVCIIFVVVVVAGLLLVDEPLDQCVLGGNMTMTPNVTMTPMTNITYVVNSTDTVVL